MNPAEVQLDLRDCEPPLPLLKTLEAVATLPPGANLCVRTRWRPGLLFAELEKRGFIGESEEQADGSCLTRVRHV